MCAPFAAHRRNNDTSERVLLGGVALGRIAHREVRAMRLALLIALALLLGTFTAEARRCPQEISKINAALPNAKISAAQKAEVEKLRDEGQKLHAAGNHPASEAALDKAKAILKIQ
jgi:hypothetical protein